MPEIKNIKKKYSSEDFNPFEVFSWLSNNKYHLGAQSQILVVGNSKRFQESIIKGFKDQLRESGVPYEELPVVYNFNGYVEMRTPSGAVIRVMYLEDSSQNHMAFHEMCDWSNVLGLCSKYADPTILNILRDRQPVITILDFSENNKN